jgi:hypothetical protein
MDLLLLITGFLILLLGGSGIALLIVPPKYVLSAPELLTLSFLFGVAFVSLMSFGVGLLLSGVALRLSISFACVALGAIGITMRLRKGERKRTSICFFPTGIETLLLIVTLAIQVGTLTWWSFNSPLGGDGLAIWDLKARLACLNGGVLPLSYFFDTTRIWSHPEYPLFLPLTEVWFYGWLGRCDQGLVKLIFPMFYLAALGLLYTGVTRLGGQRWQKFVPLFLMFFVPFTRIGEGSATSAYADFPVAVFYLASVVYLLDYWRTNADGAIRLFSALAAVLPWIKQEGSLLWLCLVALAIPKLARDSQIKPFLAVVLPGSFTFIGWNSFVRLIHAPVGQDFLPFTPAVFWSNLGRAVEIGHVVAGQMLNWYDWSLLWPGVILALPLFISKSSRKQPVTLLSAITLPVILYSGIFLFSAWSPYIDHVYTSISRLLLQVSLVAILIVGLAAPIGISHSDGVLIQRTPKRKRGG